MIPDEIRETIRDALDIDRDRTHSTIMLRARQYRGTRPKSPDVPELKKQLRLIDAANAWLAAQPQFIFDWDAIPPGYDWAVVEPYRNYSYQVHAHLYEPHWDKENAFWQSDGDFEPIYLVPDLPLGLDCRTLKERRKGEVTP